MLTEKEWLFINEIIQEIYKSKTLSGLGEIFLLLLRKLIPFKAAELTLVDDQLHDKQYAAVGISEDDVREYNEKYVKSDYRNAIFTFPKSMSYCDSDLINEEKKRDTALYKNWLAPMGMEFCGGLMIRVSREMICCINIFRGEAHGSLTERDLFILDLFIGHLENIIAGLMTETAAGTLKYEYMKEYDSLTRREKEIFPYILKGYSNSDISEAFYVSESTAKKHVYNIISKFGVSSRGELIKYVISAQQLLKDE